MIDVKQAVAAAFQFAGTVLEREQALMRLEEVEVPSDSRNTWWITLSVPAANAFGLEFPSTRRDYKTFLVDAQSGQVLSMKIREVAGAE